jgi:ABC-type multidrug transport system fused ATPase/permease subunit
LRTGGDPFPAPIKIVVIKDGAVAETGTPRELIEKQGIFAAIAQGRSIRIID